MGTMKSLPPEKWFSVDCRWVTEGTYTIGCENEQRAIELALKAINIPQNGQPISETFEVVSICEVDKPDKTLNWGEEND